MNKGCQTTDQLPLDAKYQGTEEIRLELVRLQTLFEQAQESLKKLQEKLNYAKDTKVKSQVNDPNSAISHCTCLCCYSKNGIEISKTDTETQTFETDFYEADFPGSTEDWKPPEGTNLTVTDLVKEAIEEKPQQSDYIYDENFKMYYSPSTGYYFDMERNLFYEPYSGTYYKYNSENHSYQFYYQINNNEHNGNSISTENKSTTSLIISSEPSNLKIKDSKGYQVAACSNKIGKEVKKRRKKKTFKKEKITKTLSEDNGNIDVKDNIILNAEENDSRLDSENISVENSLEEGELSSPYSESTSTENDLSATASPCAAELEEGSSETWPPCIRAVVEDSMKLKIGSLLLITCTGAIIGRDKNHSLFIPDVSVSKTHAEITYDNDAWQYSISDFGSQNGTFINDCRLSEPKEKSLPHPLKHGDHLSIGSCKLLLHIHPGGETCDDCEPGQIQAGHNAQQEKMIPILKSRTERENERRQQLRQMKKKFGLENMNYVDGENVTPSSQLGYQDRAKERRKTKGSANPYEKDAEPATLDKKLSSANKGYQLLKKMGWSEGQTLGANNSGISEPTDPMVSARKCLVMKKKPIIPEFVKLTVSTGILIGELETKIPLHVRQNKAGLGSSRVLADIPEDPRKRKWRKAQKRYQQMEQSKPEYSDSAT